MKRGVVLTMLCFLASCAGVSAQDSYTPRLIPDKTNPQVLSLYACIEKAAGDRFKQLGCR